MTSEVILTVCLCFQPCFYPVNCIDLQERESSCVSIDLVTTGLILMACLPGFYQFVANRRCLFAFCTTGLTTFWASRVKFGHLNVLPISNDHSTNQASSTCAFSNFRFGEWHQHDNVTNMAVLALLVFQGFHPDFSNCTSHGVISKHVMLNTGEGVKHHVVWCVFMLQQQCYYSHMMWLLWP